MPHVNAHALSNNEIYQLRLARWRARTDLTYLASHVLGYKDVTGPDRFPFMNRLQKFPLPKPDELEKYDRLDRGNWVYTPYTPMTSLPGGRRVLILDPRGFLKTTINAQSHSIQWIINYPDVAMTVVQSNGKKSRDIVGEIKHHFQANPRFRGLFPEHCPTKRIFDWGNLDEFTTEARSLTNSRKEKTMMTGSIDTGSAGYHFDVMKFSDIVEPNNVKTSDQIESVVQSFGMMENLLVAPSYWIDVEGTRYDFSDLYGRIIEAERKRPIEQREWAIHVRGAYKKDTEGKAPQFTPEELDLPYLFDEHGQKISWWPERWPVHELEKRRTNPAIGEYTFACQQLNDPVAVGDESTIPFPVNKDYPKWISLDNFKQNVKIVHFTSTVDTAETKSDRADYTCITTVGWDQAGRAYVVEIRHGKWLPDEIITQMIAVQLKWRPLYMSIEETSYVRGFKDGLQRRLQVSGLHINLQFIKRETTISKTERILNTLQPWYKHGELRFVRNLGHPEGSGEAARVTESLVEELRRFPRYRHDDILDSLSDHFQGRDWVGRLAPRPNNPWDATTSEDQRKQIYGQLYDQMLGINKFPFETVNTDQGSYIVPVPQDGFYNRTGGL